VYRFGAIVSEESHITKQTFLAIVDALRVMNATAQHSNTMLGSVVDELKSIHRGQQEIVQRMDASVERQRDLERRMSEGERKSDGKIKLLERRLDNHDEQIATLRKSAI
jgi:hypothetical protein